MKPSQGDVLLRLARGAIHEALGLQGLCCDDAGWLNEPGASFITLTRAGKLRGCIGTIEAKRPLGEDVRSNAVAAATRDPRFDPLESSELFDLSVEVTVLSPLQRLLFTSEEEAILQIRPQIDGLVLSFRDRRGTFLPQLWEHVRTTEEFLAQLKKKTGLPSNFWDPEICLHRFTVEKWRERAPAMA
jgi:AmmeMemoRadiSam system protein A